MDNELNIESTVDDIASDIGLTTDRNDNDQVDNPDQTVVDQKPGEATEEVEALEKTADEKATEAAAAAATQARVAPKAWAKEHHERFSKLDKETQDYIEHREKQMLDGLSQYSEKAKRADVWETAVKDYLPLIQAQGAQPQEAVRYLFEAHRQLSSGSPEQRAAYLAKVAQTYGIDFAKAASGAAAAGDEPASVKELRERTEKLEKERADERAEKNKEITTRIASEVTTFADAKDEKGNPKHPYFDECSKHIVALINAGHTLQEAYEQAVYANPVTREKEIARLQTEKDAALRAKAKQEAERARNASRTNVNSRDTRREPTASKVGNWEAGMEDTLQEIKARTH